MGDNCRYVLISACLKSPALTLGAFQPRTAQDTSSKYILCICGACFLVVGIALGVSCWPITGCFVGIIPLVLLICAGAVAGHFFLKRFAQHFTQRHYFVNTGGGSKSPKSSESSRDMLQ